MSDKPDDNHSGPTTGQRAFLCTGEERVAETCVRIVEWLGLICGFYGRRLIGALANLAGLPGFVRECDYQASACRARVVVRTGPTYTTVTVNGLDIYFRRLTGAIDGL